MIYDQTALANALMFDQAYRTLYEKFNTGLRTNNLSDMGLLVPVAVNCAFSCELFLKSMLPVGSRGHKLYNDLFTKLDSQSQDAIIDGTVKLTQLSLNNYTSDNFHKDLEANEKAFEVWRYFHEKNASNPSFNIRFMSNFQEVVKSLAIFYNKQSKEL